MRRLPGSLILAMLLGACSGGNSLGTHSPCAGACSDAPQKLEVADVQRVLAQGIAEARARGAAATLAVVDRSGNVLAVYRMAGAASSVRTDGGRGVSGGLDNIPIVPDTLAVIAKAITGAYLSSEGNAFTTRTAGQIIQLHFYPGEFGQPSGPLFGVQFSSLPCSDLNTRFAGARPAAGPQRSPLGLAADPGGLPLYKNGSLVGGVGAIADGVYGIDVNIRDRDVDNDEVIALAAASGFEPASDRRADAIDVDGKPLRYVDALAADFAANPAAAPPFTGLGSSDGALVSVPGYMAAGDSAIVAGLAFTTPASGVRTATGAFAALDGFVLVNDANAERYAAHAGTDAAALGAGILTTADVQQLLASGLAVANRARAQIRRPYGTPARVTLAVVDTYGAALGIVRSRDAPVFGIDVSLQKARTAALLSNSAAAGDLQATPPATYFSTMTTSSIGDYVAQLRSFLGLPTALADGAIAFTDRAGGNLSRPYFPDGQVGSNNGPLSKPVGQWSPFSTGLEEDLVNDAIVDHIKFVLGLGPDVAPGSCTALPAVAGTAHTRLANGAQIFPGSVPIYRGATLVGALGISGDGVDQDDMIAFLGVHEAGIALGGALGNAPPAMRADTLTPQGVRLRYVQCPQSPYYASDAQNVCDAK